MINKYMSKMLAVVVSSVLEQDNGNECILNFHKTINHLYKYR